MARKHAENEPKHQAATSLDESEPEPHGTVHVLLKGYAIQEDTHIIIGFIDVESARQYRRENKDWLEVVIEEDGVLHREVRKPAEFATF